jgi:hypothetical protein
MIVTAGPSLFESHFSDRLGTTIHLHDDVAAALAAIEHIHVERLFADFTRIGATWTGGRLLRHLRTRREMASTEIWLMASQWDRQLLEWVLQVGATGMTRRSARGVARVLAAASAWITGPEAGDEFVHVETVFKRYAGPMASVHADNARAAIAEGRVERTCEALVAHLASLCEQDDRRSMFLAAVRRSGRTEGLAQGSQPLADRSELHVRRP